MTDHPQRREHHGSQGESHRAKLAVPASLPWLRAQADVAGRHTHQPIAVQVSRDSPGCTADVPRSNSQLAWYHLLPILPRLRVASNPRSAAFPARKVDVSLMLQWALFEADQQGGQHPHLGSVSAIHPFGVGAALRHRTLCSMAACKNFAGLCESSCLPRREHL